ncbi:MAG TPA: MIP/aquaporin family protein [Actinomycetota bacterium]
MERTTIQKLLAEFVGTFALIFIGVGSIVAANFAPGAGLVTVAIAHGLAIATMVTAVGHVSGAHFNPAVTIGAWVTGKIKSADAGLYIGTQLLGGIVGALAIRAAIPREAWLGVNLGTPLVSGSIRSGSAVLIEAILTFFLVWVVFATAIDEDGAFNKVAGLAIGFVILMDIMMGGPFTGAAMNPARSFGPALVGGFWDGWWVYWVGPIAGGIIAAVLYDSIILARREPAAALEAAPGE